jgi:asparagine synthase (glutamine-hydrolysing)
MRHRWYTRELTEHFRDEEARLPATLSESLAYSIYSSPLPRLLRVEDRNSMAHSIESRLPFLDHRLVSFVFSLPDEWRLRGPWNKYVQREAMRGRIPESVRTRADKMGFPVPARNWLAGILHEPVLDLMLSRGARERGIYNVDSIIADVERHRRGEVNMTDGIFDVAQLEVWLTL